MDNASTYCSRAEQPRESHGMSQPFGDRGGEVTEGSNHVSRSSTRRDSAHLLHVCRRLMKE